MSGLFASGWLGRLAALFLLSLAVAGPAMAEKRIALVIGNSGYAGGAFGPLSNPVSDAQLMSRTLRELGFEVELLTNANQTQMTAAMKKMGGRLNEAGPDAVGLFYFAGHGVQSQGRNYLIPVDSRARTEQDVWTDAPRMGLVEQYMEYGGNRVNFIIIDACRTNNLPSTSRSSGGLAKQREVNSQGVLVAYSTQPSATASDGSATNSPYTSALAQALKTQGLIAEQVFKRVGDQVRAATGNAQQPWYESGLSGDDFCFTGCGAAAGPVAARPVVSVAATAQPRAAGAGDVRQRLLGVLKANAGGRLTVAPNIPEDMMAATRKVLRPTDEVLSVFDTSTARNGTVGVYFLPDWVVVRDSGNSWDSFSYQELAGMEVKACGGGLACTRVGKMSVPSGDLMLGSANAQKLASVIRAASAVMVQ